ncbi:MAG: Rid family hydrolase [Gemmatimonadota bacterium]
MRRNKIIVLLLGGVILLPTEGSAQEEPRGWEPLVSEAREPAYERNRYAPVARIGSLVIASGVVGNTREGDNSPVAQFRRAFERLSAVLEEQGLSLRDVAEMTTYHVNMGEHIQDFITVKNEFLPSPPYPAWTVIGVDRLFREVNLIEIRVIAAMRP